MWTNRPQTVFDNLLAATGLKQRVKKPADHDLLAFVILFCKTPSKLKREIILCCYTTLFAPYQALR